MNAINETHSPQLRSWVETANRPGTDFPIQNLPHGVFRRRGSAEPFRGGVAIGDMILDLGAAHAAAVFSGEAAPAAAHAAEGTLNAFMSMGPCAWSALRLALSRMLCEGAAQAGQLSGCLVPQSQAEMAVPARIGDYTDMYTSVYHATNIGRLFRPDNPLMPNFKWLPVGYHGRASSIGVSGQQFHRPRGQVLPPGASSPVFTECKRLDYELEIGIWIGTGNALGEPVSIDEAQQHVFGLTLLNDWSARDVQAWEYQPLGPFLAKNFASTVSSWIVTMEALAPFRAPFERPAADPQPLPYLDSTTNRACGQLDLNVEAWLQTATMHAQGRPAVRLSRGNVREAAYWTLAQLVTHHTVNGCNLRSGDLFGSGTLSGPAPDQAGSLLELSMGGRKPITLPNGETRSFLQDGDTLTLRAWAERAGARRIGLGECAGTVLPAR